MAAYFIKSNNPNGKGTNNNNNIILDSLSWRTKIFIKNQAYDFHLAAF